MQCEGTSRRRKVQFLSILFLVSSPTTAAWLIPEQQPDMRPWTCHGRSQTELVDRLCQAGIIACPNVAKVMAAVDRKHYAGQQHQESCYRDTPLAIGQGQTISAPHMHAYVLQALLPSLETKKKPLRLLDVGCGSGYLTACFGRFLLQQQDGKGSVLGIDRHASLVETARDNIQRADGDVLDDAGGPVELVVADGWDGAPKNDDDDDAQTLWDVIHVGAAADPDIPPALLTQLDPHGGRLLIPVGPNGAAQTLVQVERTDVDVYERTELMQVRYVPLVKGSNRPTETYEL